MFPTGPQPLVTRRQQTRRAYACLRTFLDLNGHDIIRDETDENDEDALVALIFGLAASTISESTFEGWLRGRITPTVLSPLEGEPDG